MANGRRDGMRAEDGTRAWQVLRRVPAYRHAWRRRRPQPGLPERAPFPMRLQTVADLAAARFGLHAWEDPVAEDGPVSPFWRVAPMLPAAVGPRATPLTGDAAAEDLSVAGLRLINGSLVLRLECADAAVQFAIEPGMGSRGRWATRPRGDDHFPTSSSHGDKGEPDGYTRNVSAVFTEFRGPHDCQQNIMARKLENRNAGSSPKQVV